MVLVVVIVFVASLMARGFGAGLVGLCCARLAAALPEGVAP